MQDLWKSTTEVIRERISSPVLVPFALSWVAWNYKFLVVLASDVGVPRVFELAQITAYPHGWWSITLTAIAAPIATAAAVIFLLPRLEQWVLHKTLPRQRNIIELRRQHGNAMPLTLEESRTLREDFSRVVQLHEDQADNLREELSKTAEKLRQCSQDLEALKARRSRDPFHLDTEAIDILRVLSNTKISKDGVAVSDMSAGGDEKLKHLGAMGLAEEMGGRYRATKAGVCAFRNLISSPNQALPPAAKASG